MRTRLRLLFAHLVARVVSLSSPKRSRSVSTAWQINILGLLLLCTSQNMLAQTCNQAVNFNYSSVADGDRKTGSDKLSAGTPGTTVSYSAYTVSAPGATNTFAVGANAALANTGKFLVWQRNVTGGGPSSDVASVVFTFSRPVSNLTLTLTDIDQDLVTASFTDRVTFEGYATAVGGTPIDLQPSAFSGPGLNVKNKFVGTGSTATATTDPVLKPNALTGIANNPGVTTGDVTVSFPSAVTRVVVTYENIAPFASATTDRTHTIGFENVTFCAQSDVYASIASGPTTAQPGALVSYSALFGNNGPDDATTATRTVTIPAGATVTNLGGGVLTGNVLDFGTVSSPAGSTASFTYAYTLPTIVAPGVYFAPTTAATTTSASQNGTTANDSDTRALAVVSQTDVLTTISSPVNATQGNLVTLAVTTTNNGTSPMANVVQTVQLVANLTNVFVSNNGSYSPGSGLVTFPSLTTLGAGQTVSNTVSFSAPALSFAPVATVTPNTTATGDSNPANNTAYLNGASSSTNITISPTTTTTPVANLYTTISASSPTANSGGSVTLSGVIVNSGPASAASVVQAVQLIPGFTTATLTVNGAAPTGQTGNDLLFADGTKYNAVTGLVTFSTISSLASGSSRNYTIQFVAPANVNSQFFATSFVGSTATGTAITTDLVPADNVASTKVTIRPTADLVASLLGPTSVAIGLPVSYTAIFTNNGPAAAANSTPTVQLPAGLTGVSLSDGAYNMLTGLVSFPAVPTVPAGVSLAYTISFTPPAEGTYKAGAFVGSSTPDPVLGNNSATVVTSVTPLADLRVTLSGTATTVTGGVVTYVAETVNNGPSSANSATTTIKLPTGLALATVSSNGGTYDAATGLVTFTAPILASGTTVSYYATFANPNPTGTTLIGTANVSSSTQDPAPGNNTSAAVNTNTTTGVAPADISTTITPAAATVAPGGSLVLTVAFFSNGTAVSPVAEMLYLPPGTVASGVGLTYNQTTGVGTFLGTDIKQNGNNATDSYTVTITAPATGVFSAVSAISGPYVETNTSNNVAVSTISVTQPAASTTYDEVTVITGPVGALPGATATYTVQVINNGPAVTPSATQTVLLPVGLTPANITSNGSYDPATRTITFPAISNQAAGPRGIVTNTFTVTVPAAAYTITANVTAAGESTTNNNASSVSTAIANQVPVANNLVNALQAAEGNTAGQLAITPLSATDADGSVTGFQLTSIPDAATQGVLYYSTDGTTFTAITNPSQPLTTAQALTMRFDPVATFVGNVFFGYTATDNGLNGGAAGTSLPALYTISVGQDNASLYGLTPAKGGTVATGFSKYQNGDVLAYVTDINGAFYNSAGKIYDAVTGMLVSGVANGLPTSGTNAITNAAGTTLLSGIGLVMNAATGQISVANRLLLVAGTYTLSVTTTDLFGGVTTQPVTFVIGARPLPVELVTFEAKAARNVDVQLTWRTASEKNNDYFDVERSFSGSGFEKISQVKGQGNALAPTDYVLTDAGVGTNAAAVYYRLKQVDTDGAATYSPVRTVAFPKALAPAFGLYPNPAAATTRLDLTQLPAGTYQMSVIDAVGRVVRGASLTAGLVHVLELNALASGTYVVLVHGQYNGQVVSLAKRLVKE